MNRLMRMATIVVGVSAILSIAGCGNSTEKEYESLIRTVMQGAPKDVVDSKVMSAMAHFKKMTPEEQQKEIKKSKDFIEALKK